MADPLDILDEQEAKRAALGTDSAGGSHIDQIGRANTAVSRRIDALCGPVVAREVTEIHEVDGGVIWPHQTPVLSVTSVTEWDGTTQTALAADTWGSAGAANAYFVDGAGHGVQVLRRSSGSAYRFGPSVRLVYQAGRFGSTATVDELWKEAAAEVLRRLWNREAGAWARAADPFDAGDGMGTSRLFRAVDYVVDELLGHEKLPPGIA